MASIIRHKDRLILLDNKTIKINGVAIKDTDKTAIVIAERQAYNLTSLQSLHLMDGLSVRHLSSRIIT